jgi:hypothetical protein
MARSHGRPARLTVVLADWCPHCVPLSEKNGKRFAHLLRIPYRRLDIDDPEQERQADQLVRDHGDWVEDYLIPQVFLEWSDGTVEHVLTGFSEAVTRTRDAWRHLLGSEWLDRLRGA